MGGIGRRERNEWGCWREGGRVIGGRVLERGGLVAESEVWVRVLEGEKSERLHWWKKRIQRN